MSDHVDLDINKSFGPFVCTKDGFKLFDLRDYSQKPLCGYGLKTFCHIIKKVHEITDFYALLDNEEFDHFNKLFIATNRVENLIFQLELASFKVERTLPVITLNIDSLKVESFLKEGLYINSTNIKDNSLFLYLPLSITNLDLCDLISRIKRIITDV